MATKKYKKQVYLGAKAFGIGLMNLPQFFVKNIGTPTNDIEIAVVAQQRSGHHAIINWMRCNMNVPSVFINNCYSVGNPLLFNQSANQIVPPDIQEKPFDLDKEQKGKLTFKSCLIYNYEDQRLPYIKFYQHKINRVAWLGKSRRFYKVLIIRDPFNLLASKLKWSKGKQNAPSLANLFFIKNQWKRYAKYYLEHYKQDNHIVCIDYNSWFAKEAMQKKYAEQLGLASYNKGLKKVSQYGPKEQITSFDSWKKGTDAQNMKVMERWQFFQEDENYLKLIADKELIELSQELYADFSAVAEAIDFAKQL